MTKSKPSEELGRQLKRGTLEMILLRLLAERPKYGYELVSELAERAGGGFELKEGTLYPVLYRLEDQGFIVPEWRERQAGERGVPRKYYRLTGLGEHRFGALRQEWQSFRDSVEQLLDGAPSGTPKANDHNTEEGRS